MTPKQKRITAAATIATAIAVPAEGLRQWAYYDPPGILTVCYGSTKNVVKGKKYSIEECNARLGADMREAINIVDECVPNLPVHVLAAFGDAVYNLGPTIACNQERSTAARMLDKGNLEGACKQLPKWNKAKVAGTFITLPGLTKRRAEEMAVCLEGVS